MAAQGRFSAALLLLAAQLAIAGSITGSAHDFIRKGWAGGRICLGCHATGAAAASEIAAPLWNATNSTRTYPLYGSPARDATTGSLRGNSRLCLSCHDGTIADRHAGDAVGTTMVGAGISLGTGRNGDHPIGVVYNTARAASGHPLLDPGAKTVTIGSGDQTKTGTVAEVMLYDGKMECSSCHDVHNTFTPVAGKLVKISMTGRALCLACHSLAGSP